MCAFRLGEKAPQEKNWRFRRFLEGFGASRFRFWNLRDEICLLVKFGVLGNRVVPLFAVTGPASDPELKLSDTYLTF